MSEKAKREVRAHSGVRGSRWGRVRSTLSCLILELGAARDKAIRTCPFAGDDTIDAYTLASYFNKTEAEKIPPSGRP